MYSWILLIGIIALLVLSYFVFKSFLSPSVELLLIYLAASVCLLFFVNSWQPAITLDCVLKVLSALLFFIAGDFFAQHTPAIFPKMWTSQTVFFSKIRLKADLFSDRQDFYLPGFALAGGIALQILALGLRLAYTVSLLDVTGHSGNYRFLIGNAYMCKYFYDNVPEEPQITTFLCVISACFAFICLFIFFSGKKKKAADLLYLIPMLFHLATETLLGGRSFIFQTAFSVLFLFLFFQYRRKEKHILRKTVLFGGVLAVAFLLAYALFGFIRGSGNYDFSYFLSYPASPLQALNCWLLNPTKAAYFGEETFITQQGILNKLGFSLKVAPLPLPYIEWAGGSTNIYSSIRRYLHDFGYSGMLLIQLFIGFFYGYLKKITLSTNKIWMVVWYCRIGFAILTSLFEDQFFQLIISASTVYEFFFLQLISLLVRGKEEDTADR